MRGEGGLAMSGILLDTPCGQIRGVVRNGVRVFLGVRYAATPPFERPIETVGWEGVFDATENGADCWQYGAFNDEAQAADSFYYNEFRNDGMARSYTGDYVTLNIVAPERAHDCPVLAFIHGGGHETGTVGELPYGACEAYAAHAVVYVSIGYRLNVFSLFENRNLGLHDLLCALRWLRRNIAAFGGDGGRVTVIGQSAGAMSITDLCYSPLARGLIQGAVLMSGGGAIPNLLAPMTRAESAPLWQAVMARVGAADAEALKNVPPETLWRVWYELHGDKRLFRGSAIDALRACQPGIDGEIITDRPSRIVRRGGQLNIPYIFGVTSQDYLPVILYEMALKWGLRQHRAGMRPVYGYFFDRTLPGHSYKAWHAADMWYMFGNMDKSWRPFAETDYRLSAQMIAYTANFAKTGDPNGPALSAWKPLGGAQRGFRLLDGQSDRHIAPAKCRRKVLHTMLFDKGPM